MSADRRVLLVEFTESHHVLFYAQIVALRAAGYEPHAFVDQRFVERIPVAECASVMTFDGSQGPLRGVRAALKVCSRQRFPRVVLNTANGSAARNFALGAMFLPGLEVIGINHYIRKFTASATQRLISLKVKKYFVLSDLFRETGALPESIPGITVHTFYPIFYPQLVDTRPPDQGLRLVIPGSVQQSRRDYFGLLELLDAARNDLPSGLVVVLLGASDTPDGMVFRARVAQLGLEDRFEFHDGFVSVTEYDRILRSAHLLLPLLHTDDPAYEEFLSNKVSGAYHIGPGYTLPYLMFAAFARFEDFRSVSFFYDRSTFAAALRAAGDPEARAQKRSGYQGVAKFSLEAQSRAYAGLLEA